MSKGLRARIRITENGILPIFCCIIARFEIIGFS